MRFQLQKRRTEAPVDLQPEFTEAGADKIIVSTSWFQDDGSHVERYQVLTLRGDKIADIQGCSSRRQAERFARRA